MAGARNRRYLHLDYAMVWYGDSQNKLIDFKTDGEDLDLATLISIIAFEPALRHPKQSMPDSLEQNEFATQL